MINHTFYGSYSWLDKRYQEALGKEQHYALIHMNIKSFRYINFSYGYDVGQMILKKVYDIMLSMLEENDTLCRLERDHFVILKQYEQEEESPALDWIYRCVDILFEIDEPHTHHNIYTTFGVCPMNDPDVSIYEADDKAILSYDEKIESTRGRVFNAEHFNETIYENYMEYHRLEEYVSQARRDDLYEVYLQPKIDVKTEKIIGAEALLRLFDKEGNMIPLPTILPILNENRYIRVVDLSLFEKILILMRERMNQELSIVPISVNLSKTYFNDERALAHYSDLTKKYNIPNKNIEVELLETISLDDEEELIRVVNEFRDAGFSCAIDDFGSGFSSFAVLRNTRLTTVKLDRVFFMENRKGDNHEIIKVMIQLIKSLGMKVIAEGVEKKEDVDFLKTLDCDAIQGFYYYRPMPMKEFYKLLDKQS